MGEEAWGSWPGEGRWYLCLARVLSICPFVASGVEAGRGTEMRGVSPGLAAYWQLQLSGGKDSKRFGGQGASETGKGSCWPLPE